MRRVVDVVLVEILGSLAVAELAWLMRTVSDAEIPHYKAGTRMLCASYPSKCVLGTFHPATHGT